MAYRYKNLTPRLAETVIAYAGSKVNQEYDFGGAAGGGARANPEFCRAVVGAVTPGPAWMAYKLASQSCDEAAAGKWQDPNKYYCSELVLESFLRAGLQISSVSPSVSVPQDIVNAYNSGVLEYVGHLR